MATRESEERYRILIEMAYQGVATLDGRGTITYVNPRLVAMLGFAEGELVGRPLFEFMAEPDQFSARTRFARLTATSKARCASSVTACTRMATWS